MIATQSKSGDRRYTVNRIRSGQPRPYADHIDEFDLLIEWIPYSKEAVPQWVPNDLNEDLVIKAAKTLGCNWVDKPNWHEPTLQSKSKIGLGHWKFIVKTAFTD